MYLDEPYSSVSSIHHERLVGIWLRIIVGRLLFSIEWFLLIFYSRLFHSNVYKCKRGEEGLDEAKNAVMAKA